MKVEDGHIKQTTSLNAPYVHLTYCESLDETFSSVLASSNICDESAPKSVIAPVPAASVNVCGEATPKFRNSHGESSGTFSNSLAIAPSTSSRPASKLKSADEVMQNYPNLCTPQQIGSLTKKLAKEVFFFFW